MPQENRSRRRTLILLARTHRSPHQFRGTRSHGLMQVVPRLIPRSWKALNPLCEHSTQKDRTKGVWLKRGLRFGSHRGRGEEWHQDLCCQVRRASSKSSASRAPLKLHLQCPPAQRGPPTVFITDPTYKNVCSWAQLLSLICCWGGVGAALWLSPESSFCHHRAALDSSEPENTCELPSCLQIHQERVTQRQQEERRAGGALLTAMVLRRPGDGRPLQGPRGWDWHSGRSLGCTVGSSRLGHSGLSGDGKARETLHLPLPECLPEGVRGRWGQLSTGPQPCLPPL